MAKNNNLTDFLTGVANAIRTKKGTAAPINPQNFESEIASITTGLDTSDATAVASDILLNKTAYAKGVKITGTISNYDGSYEDAPKSLEDSTWAEINTASQDGTASAKYSIGDEKNITLTTGEEITLQILGFNHDDLSSGSGKAGITFGMKNLLATMYPMNSSETSRGGWNSSRMRTSTMATLLSQLPTDLKSIVKKVSKKTVKDTDETAVIVSTDSLFLLSRVEVEGESVFVKYKDEGTQYAYWAAHSTSSDRIKKLSNGTGSKEDWWLRSPSVAASYDPGAFWYMYGSANLGSVNKSKGVCFAFCV